MTRSMDKTTRASSEHTTVCRKRVCSATALVRQHQVPADGILLRDQDLRFFNEGTHLRLYEKLGAQEVSHEDIRDDRRSDTSSDYERTA